VSARRRGSTSNAAPSYSTSINSTSVNLFGLSAEFFRPAAFAEFMGGVSTHDAGAELLHDRASNVFFTHVAPGMGTFLFATRLLQRTAGASNAAALSPTAATALRLAAAAAETNRPARETRGARETRAARPEGMALELIRHRREQVLHLPRPGYVFTQPARAQLEERQVITKASREEIVEVVRKEVRSLAASAPAVAAPSRADVAGLADEVYSTLVRRLMVEKERLGRF
jgi:hypothetical protein